MSFSDALTIIGIAASCLIALIGGIYGIVSDTKKFELAEAYKKELFSWYCEVLSIITRMEAQPSETDALLLGRFSALIDIGRFYFPNDIYRKPEIGRTRPRIYWGYRQLPLDFLVLIYEIAKSGNMERETDVVQYLKGEYSSAVFQVIAPEERIRYIDKHTQYKSLPQYAIEDYVQKSGVSGDVVNAIRKYYR